MLPIKKIIFLVLGFASIWNVYTVYFGTIIILQQEGLSQVVSASILTVIILNFLYNTENILIYTSGDSGTVLKFFWFLAIIYDFTISYVANSKLLFNAQNFTQLIIFIYINCSLLLSPVVFASLDYSKNISISTKLLYNLLTFSLIILFIFFIIFIVYSLVLSLLFVPVSIN